MTTSDWITFWGTVATVLFGVISAGIAIFTLRQNSRMIEESTRPYISIYFDVLFISSQQPRFIFKNFGKTGATITDFEYPDIIRKVKFDNKGFINSQFDKIKGIYLSPGQSFAITWPEFPKEKLDNLSFKIDYETEKKSYSDKINLSVGDNAQSFALKTKIDKENELTMTAKALDEICQRYNR